MAMGPTRQERHMGVCATAIIASGPGTIEPLHRKGACACRDRATCGFCWSVLRAKTSRCSCLRQGRNGTAVTKSVHWDSGRAQRVERRDRKQRACVGVQHPACQRNATENPDGGHRRGEPGKRSGGISSILRSGARQPQKCIVG